MGKLSAERREQIIALILAAQKESQRQAAIRERRQRFRERNGDRPIRPPRRVHGTYVSGSKCTDKCKRATGDTCRCECAGRNHGTYAL